MNSTNHIVIRDYNPSHRAAIRRITFDTAFLGESAGIFFDDEEILCDVLSIYFTDYELQSCFVAMLEGKVVGYVFGTKNIAGMNRIFSLKILMRLAQKAIRRGTLCSRKIQEFLMHCGFSFLRGELFTPDFSREYPATFHINIAHSFRGLHIGSKLIAHFFNYLSDDNIPGVHCSTMSENAKNFFVRMGFKILFETKRTFWKHYAGESLTYYVLGKKLD